MTTPSQPARRYGLIATLAISCLAVLAALSVAIGFYVKKDSSQSSTNATTTSTSEEAASPEQDKVCYHDEEQWATGPLLDGPEVEWEQRGNVRFPESDDYGPAAVDEEGFRYCFQHSVEGAVLAATTNVIQAFDYPGSQSWLDYFASEGAYRDSYVTTELDAPEEALNHENWVVGFEVHEYDASSAELEIFIISDTPEFPLSVRHKLVWDNGDWKIDASQPDALRTAYTEDFDDITVWGSEESFT